MKKQVSATLLSTLCALGIAATPRQGHAQTSKEAEDHNDAGKALFKERRYLEAYRRFKQAAAISPEGRFYFNICFSLNYLERFQEAIEACEQVEPNGADEALMKKTNAVLAALRAKVPAPTPTPDPNAGGTTTDPNAGGTPTDPNAGGVPVDPNAGGTTTDPNAGGTPTDPNAGGVPVDPNTGLPVGTQTGQPSTGPAQVPGLDPFAPKKPTGEYAWSLGATLVPLVNMGIGDGEFVDGQYAGGGFGLNIFANFMYKPEQQLGLQGYIGFANLPADDAFDPLVIADFGGALYKHVALSDKMDITPLIGANVSLMQPDSDTDEGFLAIGFRLQGSLDYYLGSNKEHVVSFAPAIRGYSGASSGGVLDAESFGLDSGGAALEIGFGYQYRFTTPFGAGPLFTLE